MMLAILFVALGTALAAASPIVSNQPVNGETAITGPIAGKKPPPSLGFCYNMCGPDFRHCQQHYCRNARLCTEQCREWICNRHPECDQCPGWQHCNPYGLHGEGWVEDMAAIEVAYKADNEADGKVE